MLILVTGGSRSGKSSFALSLAEKREAPRVYLATAQALDSEMQQRIEAHRRDRPAGWGLVEEPLQVPRALAGALAGAPGAPAGALGALPGAAGTLSVAHGAPAGARTVLLDCVTLWMSNLLLDDDRFDERAAEEHARELVEKARGVPGTTVIVVTNEVGSGVVPETALGRRFRDVAGRANEVIARAADEVYFMVSGIPLRIKPRERTDDG
jgi:adenosylcobinamide kinase/adenosylcobinamide-phosphate guanylyltransferase